MGGKRFQGVKARPSSILIDLRSHGFGQERLTAGGEPLAPTPGNLKYAEQYRARCIEAIDKGTFRVKDFFPDSKHAEREQGVLTFGELVEEWLTIKASELAVTTTGEYRNALRHNFGAWWDRIAADVLTYRTVMKRIGEIKWGSVKTRNNVVNVLRGVLAYARKAKIITEDISVDLTNSKGGKRPEPDPFDLDEIGAILADMKAHYGDEGAHNYYEVAFFTGFRPSEQIALLWPKVDLNRGIVRIDAARVRWRDKDTKTHVVRDVELVTRAFDALKRQEKLSYLAHGPVFRNPRTGENFKDTSEPLDLWWKPTLKRLRIRYRDARQTRHSFASIALTLGVKPPWAAAQLGHSVEMFYRTYATWIAGLDKGNERKKFDSELPDSKTGQSWDKSTSAKG